MSFSAISGRKSVESMHVLLNQSIQSSMLWILLLRLIAVKREEKGITILSLISMLI